MPTRLRRHGQLSRCSRSSRRPRPVRRGKGGRCREVGMDAWGWEELRPWLELRVKRGRLGHANLGTISLGRDGARCRRCRRPVSPSRPPNRTCTLPRIRLSTGHAMADRDAGFMRRRFPVEWWLGLFRCPPTARGCGARDSDIGSPEPRRARRASCLRGWSSGAPSTVA